jgi:hypothetical protein
MGEAIMEIMKNSFLLLLLAHSISLVAKPEPGSEEKKREAAQIVVQYRMQQAQSIPAWKELLQRSLAMASFKKSWQRERDLGGYITYIVNHHFPTHLNFITNYRRNDDGQSTSKIPEQVPTAVLLTIVISKLNNFDNAAYWTKILGLYEKARNASRQDPALLEPLQHLCLGSSNIADTVGITCDGIVEFQTS